MEEEVEVEVVEVNLYMEEEVWEVKVEMKVVLMEEKAE